MQSSSRAHWLLGRAQALPPSRRLPDSPRWPPAPRSQMAAFTQALGEFTGQRFADPAALQAWSVREFRGFWHFFVAWCGGPLGLEGSAHVVCEGDTCEHARFFPGLRLNYADSLLNLQVADAHACALTACHADGDTVRWSRGRLRQEVARIAQALQGQGVGAGDRVVMLARNDEHAVACALAVAALGASLATAAPDMGLQAVLERFAPLAPRLLLAHTAPRSFDPGEPLDTKVRGLLRGLPSLQLLVRLDGDLASAAPRAIDLATLAAQGDAAALRWTRFAFDHPLFVLFSSGTTGRPKCIVHGAGGTLLEHVKEHRLHTDLRAGERLYFHTSCGWMMWQWQLSALASGVEIVTWDGPVATPDSLWRLVAAQRVNVFGTSPAYLRLSEDAGLAPAHQWQLDALRAILSTGAVLHDAQFDWVRAQFGALPLQSICGGTDILGCFVLGHPDLPVTPGLAQCRSLGLDVQAWAQGAPVATGRVGQLVCANPFPSRPLGFFGDADGSRMHAAYFRENPGVWTHGDLVEFSAAGGARLHGRCDGVLNVRGAKIAPAEIQRVLLAICGVREALIVPRGEGEGADAQLVALLVLREGLALDAALAARVRREVRHRLSPAHVPQRVLAVPELPLTHNGKLSEAAARCAVNGQHAANAMSLRNPGCLDAIARHPGLGAAATEGDDAIAHLPAGRAMVECLRQLWQQQLDVVRVELDDHFLDLGGNSLQAAAIISRLQHLTGRALPLSTLLQAPTIRALAALLEGQPAAPAPAVLVPLRAGCGRPLFLVHGLSGTVMECAAMVAALRTGRPVLGLHARGIDGEQPPQMRVEAIARRYVKVVRAAQPDGPYAVCGFSFGGVVALEMARQLAGAKQSLEFVGLFDTHLWLQVGPLRRAWCLTTLAARRLLFLRGRQRWAYLGLLVRRVRRARWLGRGSCQHCASGPQQECSDGLAGVARPARWPEMSQAHRRVHQGLCAALQAYRPRVFDAASVLFVRARVPLEGFLDPLPTWRQLLRGGLRVVHLPGTHLDLVGCHAPRLAAQVDAALAGE